MLPESPAIRILFALATCTIAVRAITWSISDFRAWVAIGPGGLPHTLRGWLTLNIYRLVSRNGRDARRLRGDGLLEKHVGELPVREKPRPVVAAFPVPQRQLTQTATPETLAQTRAILDAAVGRGSPAVVYKQSHFEAHTPAVTLSEQACEHGHLDCIVSHGEVAHVHPSDGSLHMVLSAGDAKEALTKGWGELHGLTGFGGRVPRGYTFVYAPQTDIELEVVGRLLQAALDHMRGGN